MEEVKIITLMPTRGIMFTVAQEAYEREMINNNQIPFCLRTKDVPIPDCRNQLVGEARQQDWWTHALLLDDDIVMPEGGLKALIEANTDVAFIDYPHHMEGFDKDKLVDLSYGVAVYDNWRPGQPTDDKDIAWAGLGCVLVKREVFEKMEGPIFQCTNWTYKRDIDTGELRMGKAGDYEDAGNAGEDTFFYFNLRRLNIKAKKIPNMVAGHLRIERLVYRMQKGRYQMQHQIKVNNRIDKPLQ